MSVFARVADRLIGAVESTIVHWARARNAYPPLFVVGTPRSGTTVVYQLLVNALELGYFPNLAKDHPRACVVFGYRARRRYHYEGSYRSEYGVVEGPAAPSDGWGIFHRWFPRYELDRPVREDRLHELRTLVRAFEKIYGAPFANKNNANSLRIPQLARLFPDARFIHVQRDLCDTVRSVLKSRTANAVPEDEWWGVAPPRFHGRAFDTELERVVYQAVDVERFITESLDAVERDRVLVVPYEDFCEAPARVLDWVVASYRAAGVTLRRRSGEAPSAFTRSSARGAHDDLDARIREIAARVETEYR